MQAKQQTLRTVAYLGAALLLLPLLLNAPAAQAQQDEEQAEPLDEAAQAEEQAAPADEAAQAGAEQDLEEQLRQEQLRHEEQAATPPAATQPTPATAAEPQIDTDDYSAKGQPAPRFIKGHLVQVGTKELLSRYDHFGVRFGPNILESQLFLKVDPGFAFYGDNLSIALHAPLNLLALRLEGREPVYGGMKVRKEDWDERADFAKVIRFLTYGRKEDNFFFSLNSLQPATIGHGMAMSYYQPSIDVNKSLTGLLFDAYNDYAGFQFQLNDVTVQNQIIGALAFIKPFSAFTDVPMAKTFSLGVEVVSDLKAPICVRNNNGLGDDCVQARDHVDDEDAFTGEPLNHTFVDSDSDSGRFAVDTGAVTAFGFSGEVKVYKDVVSDIKAYSTFHRFVNEGGGSGFGLGLLGRFSLGSRWINAFRLRTEYRAFGDGFLPEYFDTSYEVSKYEYGHNQRNFQVTPTRYQAVFGDPAHGFDRPALGQHHGYRLEGSWGLFYKQRSRKQLALGAGMSDSDAPFDSNFYAHLEFPAWQWLQFFSSYIRRGGESMKGLLSQASFDDGSAMVLTGLRLQMLLPILFLNAHWSRSFNVVRSPGQEYHLGNSLVRAPDGGEPRFAQDRLFLNRDTVTIELEIGYEFDADD